VNLLELSHFDTILTSIGCQDLCSNLTPYGRIDWSRDINVRETRLPKPCGTCSSQVPKPRYRHLPWILSEDPFSPPLKEQRD
jgi:hypothetical protein